MDCGKALGPYAERRGNKRCRPCSATARRRPDPVCVDCGKKLSMTGKYSGAVRCKGCTTRISWTGRHHKPETREKIRRVRTGAHASEKTRAKLRVAHAGEKNHFWGKHHTPESISKNSLAHSGPNHPCYRDGTSNGPYGLGWNTTRREIRIRDEHLCQHPECYRPENGKHHECHHIDRNKKNNNPANLILLCYEHHEETRRGNADYWIEYYQAVQAARGITQINFMEVTMKNIYEGEIR